MYTGDLPKVHRKCKLKSLHMDFKNFGIKIKHDFKFHFLWTFKTTLLYLIYFSNKYDRESCIMKLFSVSVGLFCDCAFAYVCVVLCLLFHMLLNMSLEADIWPSGSILAKEPSCHISGLCSSPGSFPLLVRTPGVASDDSGNGVSAIRVEDCMEVFGFRVSLSPALA